MNTSKHTPWPWFVEGSDITNGYPDQGSRILIAEKVAIESDAHLIAAAPAMYEALQRLFNGNVDCGTYWQIDVSDIQAAKQALAQAEGK